MQAHLKAVGIVDAVIGGFFTLLGVLVSAGTLLLAPRFYGAPLWRPADDVVVFAVVLLVSAVFLVVGIPNLIAGIALMQQKGWARGLAIVLAVLALSSFPLGTAAGAYTLWVLTQKETEQLLGRAA